MIDTPFLSLPAENREVRAVIVHRTTIRQDVIAIFNDADVLNCLVCPTVIDYSGREEKGKGKGVMLDVLTHFWHEVYNTYCFGSSDKIPMIRHDMQKNDWQSIARVIVYGYNLLKYFPMKISPALLCTCLFGEDNLGRELLLNSFRDYVTLEDRRVFDNCMNENCDLEDEDILDFLSMFKCFKLPTKDNIKEIMFELAHQELLQKPRYIIHCWSPVLRMLQYDDIFKTQEGILQLYTSRQPTAKKLIKLINAETGNEIERLTIDHLKRYIRSLEGKAIERFLHFITGSDCITCTSIEVTFSNLSGLQRRPIAHTCGPCLEIPTTYESYGDLASEFNNLLKEGQSWSFDIV